uniref:Uncharacterized protein n=1 Tax=Romanomermis culicivorax TaxID=13658 RepID=A0A915KFC0_ROMCU
MPPAGTPFPELEVDERYFYYLAIYRDPPKALFCKRQPYDEYTNDICPMGNNTTDEPAFKFYMKILEHHKNSLMNNSAQFIEAKESIDPNDLHSEDIVYLLQTLESNESIEDGDDLYRR